MLLVDDHDDTRVVTSLLLRHLGLRVVEAEDGQRALELIQRQLPDVPDVVVTDLAMPVMDGLELRERLRSEERTAEVPVVALTAHTLFAPAHGFDAVLCKPCPPTELAGTVQRLAESRRRH